MSEHHMSEKNDVAAKQFPQPVRPRSREKAITLFLLITIVAAGVFAFLKLGRAEDPTFTIKVFTVAACGPERQHRRCRISLPSRWRSACRNCATTIA